MEYRDRLESLRKMVEDISRRGRERGRERDGNPASTVPAVPCGRGVRDAVTVTETAYSLDHVHGEYRVGSVLSASHRLVQVIARDFREFDGLSSVAFLDTETTGLAGGTGTLAFLVGIGRFEPGSFKVTQIFLHDPAGEPEFLEKTSSALEGAAAIATFNGKSFDIPLLETRYAMNRMRFPLADPFHVDLLFPSRRIWSPVLQSCSLSSLEEAVLGFRREGDIPGWLIPSIYASYLHDRDEGAGEGAIEPVMSHNRTDILSLTVLLARLAACFNESVDRGGARSAVEALGAGLHCESLGLKREALRLYQESLASGIPGNLLPRALWGALRLSKGLRKWDQCLDLARELAGSSGDVHAWIEIAKHDEHRSKDYAAALSAARTALELLQARRAITSTSRSRLEADIHHRIQRLERKMNGNRARPST